MKLSRTLSALFAALLLLVHATPAAAQETEPDAETRALAAEHFDRGINFFNEERYDAALAELTRAYELAPAHQVLYNIARVHAALGQAVQSARAYERYLAEAGEAISGRRRRDAQAALTEQQSRIGHLTVQTDVEGATIAVDGVDVATTPLRGPIPLSAGSHTVEVRAPQRETVRRAVMIAGQSEAQLLLTLREAVDRRGTLRVEASLSDVTIRIDGEEVGITPLASTVPLRPGNHTVTATRPGYRSDERTVEISEGAEAEVRFDLRREPDPEPTEIGTLHLRLPDAPFNLRIDDEAMVGGNLDLPVGSHRLTLEVADRDPYEGTIVIPAGTRIVITPPLSWTLDARHERVGAASEQRVGGAASAIVGAVIGLGSLGILIWNEAEIAATDTRLLMVIEGLERCEAMGLPCSDLRTEGEELTVDQNTQNAVRGVSIGLTAAGLVAATVGLVFWLSAPSDEEVDTEAHAGLRLGPGNVALTGVF